MRHITLRLVAVVAALICCGALAAQRPYEGYFYNSELNIRSQLNLYADSISVPGLDMETCYGFLQGSLNGMWVILRVEEMGEKRAVVRAVSDRGGDGQDMEISLTDERKLSVKLKGDLEMKGVKDGKYVKLPKSFLLERMGKQPNVAH